MTVKFFEGRKGDVSHEMMRVVKRNQLKNSSSPRFFGRSFFASVALLLGLGAAIFNVVSG